FTNGISKNVGTALDWVQPQPVRRMSIRSALKRMRPADRATLVESLPEMQEAHDRVSTLEKHIEGLEEDYVAMEADFLAQIAEMEAGFAYAQLRLMGSKATLEKLREFQAKDILDAEAKVEKAEAELRIRRKNARGAKALKSLLNDPAATLEALVDDEE
ncbi:MAG TPA: hypothetical protein VJ246_01860, partial [Patescibacteria group bacterium]|nr:hypothetical protein [Patescibacteria group bacterium]